MTSASTTPREKTTTIRGLVGRIMVLSLTLVAAIYLVPLLIAYRMWLWLGIVVLTTGAMFLLYSTKRFVPAKYLFPGTFFLTVFLIIPIMLTIQTSFTNFGDGYRGTKEEAITSITNNSMVRTEDSPPYGLSVATATSPRAPSRCSSSIRRPRRCCGEVTGRSWRRSTPVPSPSTTAW